ncbi:MAG: hypothetical protein DMG14_23230 [Acidobacteria bacterium]|nr:MAG: hypothetical protein DMG14_23230 [Acidobacteriota bacterium]
MSAVSPYLVHLGANNSLTNWLVTEGWGKAWGIFLTAPANIDQLRRHFRHFLLVRDPDGNELYFRFYDPRVLRVYLPTCTAPEMKHFLGPTTRYLMESEDGEALLDFTRMGLRRMSLSALDSASPLDPSLAEDVTLEKPTNRRLKIRNDQMKAFSEYMDKSFEGRAAGHLRAEYPLDTKDISDDELCAFIQEGSSRAAKHQFTRETEIGIFLDLMMMFGTDFDQTESWATEILVKPDLSSEEKLERLRQHRDSELERRTKRDE